MWNPVSGTQPLIPVDSSRPRFQRSGFHPTRTLDSHKPSGEGTGNQFDPHHHWYVPPSWALSDWLKLPHPRKIILRARGKVNGWGAFLAHGQPGLDCPKGSRATSKQHHHMWPKEKSCRNTFNKMMWACLEERNLLEPLKTELSHNLKTNRYILLIK